LTYPIKTFELKISFPGDLEAALATKEEVMAWLSNEGFDSFVEGSLDGLDFDFDYARPPETDVFAEMGGTRTPILIYKYEQDILTDLQQRLSHEFGEVISIELDSLETKAWQEGWKESFIPIYTDRFVVYPPWEAFDPTKGLLPICIEPGMAFGTGQHATTILCLEMLETIWGNLPEDPLIADVGTGTGVLAIAAGKLGAKRLIATDIDQDAVRATVDNAARNEIAIDVARGSVPERVGHGFDLVMANILAIVLTEILPAMSRILANGGKLILSGILDEQADEMRQQAEQLGLEVFAVKQRSGWTALCVERPK
jgi:ribosomal protein L11 methyltransferase